MMNGSSTLAVRHNMRTLRALSTLVILSASVAMLSAACASKDDRGLANTGGSAGNKTGGGAGTGITVTGGGAGTGTTGGTGGSSSGGTDMGTAATAGETGVDACAALTGLCGGAKVEANLRIVNMLLVIDKSGSMTDPFGSDDKWTALKSALGTALTNVRTEMNFGMIMYPYSVLHSIPLDNCGDTCCEVDDTAAAVTVPVAPGTVSVMQIGDQLESTTPGGGTPTAKALAAAYDYFKNGAGASLAGDNYVLLATDGGPNCNPDLTCEGDTCTTNLDGQCTNSSNCCKPDKSRIQCLDADSVLAELEGLAAINVPTFVVGLPGTQQYSTYLDQFAEAGAVPNPTGDTKYYDVSAANGVQGLVDVFETITTQLVRSCNIPLADPPTTDLVNVAIDCTLVPHDSPDGSGWVLDPPVDPTQVILSGPVCDRLQANGAKRLDVIFGCAMVR